MDSLIYIKTEKAIRDSVVKLSLEAELSKAETIAILEYLKHDIMTMTNAEKCEEPNDKEIN